MPTLFEDCSRHYDVVVVVVVPSLCAGRAWRFLEPTVCSVSESDVAEGRLLPTGVVVWRSSRCILPLSTGPPSVDVAARVEAIPGCWVCSASTPSSRRGSASLSCTAWRLVCIRDVRLSSAAGTAVENQNGPQGGGATTPPGRFLIDSLTAAFLGAGKGPFTVGVLGDGLGRGQSGADSLEVGIALRGPPELARFR